MTISIHALLAESDSPCCGWLEVIYYFYPRSPCGERPGCQRPCERPTKDFYPRSPCGERHSADCSCHNARPDFYPRSPCGERQCTPWNSPTLCYFYPRSPCGERRRKDGTRQNGQYFYPRSPCGERHHTYTYLSILFKISIHALLAESDNRFGRPIDVQLIISIHALLAESDGEGE